MESMKLSTGKVAFKLEFDNGDTGVIYINPNDRTIHDRINDFQEHIDAKIKAINIDKYRDAFKGESKIESIDALFEMPASELQSVYANLNIVNAIESEYNDAIKEELDEVFASKISDTVFKYCQPFDMVVVEDEQGKETRELYIMHFLKWFAGEMQKYGESTREAIDKHIGKYRQA